MSLSVFKNNLNQFLGRANNNNPIQNQSEFASFLTLQYDTLIRSGFQTANNVPIQVGNTVLMEQTINSILLKTLFSDETPTPIVEDIAQSFISYWTGSQLLFPFPPPTLPAAPVTTNLITIFVYNTNPGTITSIPRQQPSDDTTPFVDAMASIIKSHLSTLQFQYIVAGLLPNGLPGVGTLIGSGFTVPG
jgi:hypothetical protein